ncbi:MAG: regulatory signaling modulator protein AmpE [Gammaproteobacteria bacterium]|nr:regulatory signaling modulator protein AmpE [Gammaproteobacteria bacterium]
MTLVVIIVSLILEHIFGRWQRLRRLSWFISYRRRLHAVLPESWCGGHRGVLLLLGIPTLIAWLLQLMLQGHFWGTLELVYSILLVGYCLGPEPFNERIDEYLKACEEHHRLEAKALAESLVGAQVPDNQWQQSSAVTKAILYEGNVRIFAVMFWFIFLGPAGALLYRCAAFLAQGKNVPECQYLQPAAERIYYFLDWLPANLLSLTFFLTGSFDDAWHTWKKAINAELDFNERNRSIVIHTGCGAMRHEVDDAFAGEERGEEYDLYWVRTARALVVRSLVVWLAGVAVLTMLGLFS